MTTPKNRDELRELIARIIDDKNDFDWNACVEDANAILDALEASGVACVPTDLGKPYVLDSEGEPIHELRGAVADVYHVLVAVSPYCKGGE